VQEDKPARQAPAHAIATPQTRTPHAATRQLPPEGQALVQSAGVSLVTQQQRAHAPLAAAACPGAALLQQVIQLRFLADCLDVLGQQAQRPVLEVASGAVTTVLVQLPAAADRGQEQGAGGHTGRITSWQLPHCAFAKGHSSQPLWRQLALAGCAGGLLLVRQPAPFTSTPAPSTRRATQHPPT
jgi:hypothetical protein